MTKHEKNNFFMTHFLALFKLINKALKTPLIDIITYQTLKDVNKNQFTMYVSSITSHEMPSVAQILDLRVLHFGQVSTAAEQS